MTIREFAEVIGVDIAGCVRPLLFAKRNHLPPIYINLQNAWTVGDGVLEGAFGSGDTIEEALIDYCSQIRGKTIVINGNTNDEIRYNVPETLEP